MLRAICLISFKDCNFKSTSFNIIYDKSELIKKLIKKLTHKRNIIAISMGSFLELFEFSLYGIYAQLFSEIFFPKNQPYINILFSFGIFAAGFLSRPIGAYIFGYIGDKYGRTKSLLISIPIMLFATFSIGLLPTYQQIGLTAPILLLMLRILQGVSVGGEYSGAIVYLVELMPYRKGFAGALIAASGMLGTLFAILLSYCALKNLWSWRFPFLFSILISSIIFFIRLSLIESDLFDKILKQRKNSNNPFFYILRKHRLNFFATFLIGGANGIFTFHFIVYLNFFVTHYLHIPTAHSLLLNAISVLFFIISCILLGHKVQNSNNKLYLIIINIFNIKLSLFLYYILNTKSYITILCVEIIFGILAGGYSGIINSFICQLFPIHVRYTGVAVAYSLGIAIFGGTVPLMCNFLIAYSHSNLLMPGAYLIIASLMAIIGIRISKT